MNKEMISSENMKKWNDSISIFKSNSFFLFVSMMFLLSCNLTEEDRIDEFSSNNHISAIKSELDILLKQSLEETKQPFDWNQASNEVIFNGLLVTKNYLTIGYNSTIDHEKTKLKLLQLILSTEEKLESEIFISQEPRINILQVKIFNIETIAKLRTSSLVDFIELPAYPLYLNEVKKHLESTKKFNNHQVTKNIVLDPFSTTTNYINQLAAFSDESYNIALNHKVDKVYDEYKIFGEDIGIAVLDNGVAYAEQNFLFENGYGARKMKGYYNPTWFFPWTQPDGSIPRNSDMLGLSFLAGLMDHGWLQNQRVIALAPNANQYNVRASNFVLNLFPDQTNGITNSILEMADDDDINIISLSMASLFRQQQVENAIDYYLNENKLLVAAAGTSLPIIKDIIGIMFPGNYEPVITASSINNTDDTNGQLIASPDSHTGIEVDFCIEGIPHTSGATSILSSFIALLWSANPTLSAEEIEDILIESSYFYLNGNTKNEILGWGTPDINIAIENALN